MMNGGAAMGGFGWMGDGVGLFWVQILVVVAVVVLMAWIFRQMGKQEAPGRRRRHPGKNE